MIYDFAVIGGDMRQVYLANYLKNQRYQVITYATKKEGSECKEGKSFENVIREAKCIIGPVVFSKNGEITGSSSNKKMSVETLFQEMTKEQILFGGCINEEIRHECEQKEIKAFDFMKMDDVAIYNAIATAEGAIMEAIKMQPINLHKSRCLVLGYGRCAKVLAAKLKGMDAQVTVCARNKTARSLAKSFGLEVMDFTELKRRICQYDHIFNTVPKQILKEDILRKISKESCIIDIASYPGGTNHQMAEKLGICAKLCPSLPGIYSPKSSGIMLAKKVLEISGEIKHGIEKSHVFDAFVISKNFDAIRLGYYYKVRLVRRHNRQIHKQKIPKGGIKRPNQSPFEVFGFRLFDRVMFENSYYFIFARRKTGSFNIRDIDGKNQRDITYKKLKLSRCKRFMVQKEMD